MISFGGSVAAAMTASIAKAASVLAKVTRYLGKFGKLLDTFMQFLVKFSGKIEVFTRKLRVGVMPGETKFGIGAAAQGFQPSNRVLTTGFGTSVGAQPFVAGAGVKAGIAAGRSAYTEGKDAVTPEGDEPWFDKSKIGGDKSPEETRRNLDI
nr:hypothetical protein [Amycolatopsis sulphurea]